MSETNAFMLEAMLAPPAGHFRSSDLQRRYRQVLDSARQAPVLVTDSDGHQLAIADWDQTAFAMTFLRIIKEISQFHAVWSVHHEEPPAGWAAMTPFPFLAAFDVDEVRQFANELIPFLEEAVRRRDLQGWIGNLRAWESSAETHGDESMLAQMNIELNPDELVPLSPPTD